MKAYEKLLGIWLAHRRIHYGIAFMSVLVFFILRMALANQSWLNIQYLWFTLPVCISAFLGGLWPGIFATGLSLVTGFVFFTLPSKAYQENPETFPAQIISFALVWTFVSIICDLMRNATIRYRDVALERDTVRRQFANILGGVSDGFCAIDRNYRVLLTNRAFRSIFETDGGEIHGTSLWSLFELTADSKVKSELDMALATAKPVMFDHKISSDGRWFHLRAFPNSDGLFLYTQDISDRREMEESKEKLLEEERAARSEAETANRLRDEFVATVSHELRTPLTAILGWSEILSMRAETTSNQDLADGLRAIERSTRLQAQLIDDLLDVSRLANGKLRLNVEVVDLREVADQAIQSSQTAADAKNVKLHADYSPDDTLVRGDFARLVQIVANLVSNAVKFSSKEGNVWITIRRTDGYCSVTVQDEGVGIDQENLPIIFDRFRQANSTITRRHGGLGLGLAIVKQLTDLHGGTVTASSPGQGQGSTFTVSLTAAPFNGAADRMVGKLPKSASRVDGIKVLVVEDDDATRKLLTVVLKDAGAHVGMARNALEGLDEIERSDFDIILSDISMPEMDGYAFLQTVRENGNTVPAVALSAFARPEDRQKSLEVGYSDHLTKPVDMNRLLGTINVLTKENQTASL